MVLSVTERLTITELTTGAGLENIRDLINLNNTFTVSYWLKRTGNPPTGVECPYLINGSQSNFLVITPGFISYL